MSNNPIIFNLGEETRPVVETNLADSMFAELYQKAFVEINSYLESVEKNKKQDSIYVNEGVNNIFAFIGERGSGKTSCMLTVAEALRNDTQKKKVLLESLGCCDNAFKTISDINFEILDIIDPSFFDTKNNILSLIIAKLFKTFKRVASQFDCRSDEANRRDLIGLFEEVQKNLFVLFSKDDHIQIDSLESLSKLSAAVDLKDNIYNLVESYLKFVSRNNNVSACKLVVMIDDIDLHTQHAREMVEQVRKYFIQSNVLILMSVKIDQLNNVLKNHFTDEYKALLKQNQIKIDLLDEMSERYIGKLIPHGHRFYLPDATVHFNAPLIIMRDNKDIKYGEVIEKQYKEETNFKDFPCVRYRVLALIYEKTRYLLYNTAKTTSYIIPTNLRELRQLISMLAEMDAYHDKQEGVNEDLWEKTRLYNKTLFRNYFLETWSNNNLSVEGRSLIRELFEIKDATIINKNCILLLYRTLLPKLNKQTSIKRGDGKEEENDEIQLDSFFDLDYINELIHILDIKNISYNISLGDILSVLDYLDLISSFTIDKKLLFAIRFFYSIRLYEYYDELHSFNQQDTDTTDLVKQDVLSIYSNYSKLTAGSLINSDIFRILRDNKKNSNRSKRQMSLSAIHNNIKNQSNTPIAEFLLLFMSRRFDSGNRSEAEFRRFGEYRADKDVFRSSTLDKVYFDIESFFYNLIDIESCYKRIKDGSSFFEKCLTTKTSLLLRIMFLVDKKKDGKLDQYLSDLNSGNKLISIADEDPFLTKLKVNGIISLEKSYSTYKELLPYIRSAISIRNIEVLDDLKQYLWRNKPKGASTEAEHIGLLFKELVEYKIDTYDDHYQINWSFLRVFIDVLSEKNSDIDSYFK